MPYLFVVSEIGFVPKIIHGFVYFVLLKGTRKCDSVFFLNEIAVFLLLLLTPEFISCNLQ